jgi:metallo-beta-lactamase class B
MNTKSKVLVAGALLIGSLMSIAHAQPAVTVQLKPQEHYVRPFPPFRIVGNLYYVGTYDLAVYLITTPQGHILVNTGVNDSAPVIKANVEKLGFQLSDVKLLTATHGHWDHVGAFAEIKRMTGAPLLVHEADAGLVESGGSEDYRFPQGRGTTYEPVKVDRRLREGDKIRLGGTELTVLHHPGHTKGSTSFSFTVQDAGRDYNVLIINMGSINPGVTVSAMAAFPEITDAYTSTLTRQKQMQPDIWVASHAAQFNMHQKYKAGDPYDPNRFVDPNGFGAKIQFYDKLFRAALTREREAKAKQQ